MVSVPHPEIARDIHSRRAGHAVAASRAAVLHPASDQGHNLVNSPGLLRRKGTERGECLQIVLHLLHGRHAAENHLHIGQTSHPAQGKGCGGSLRIHGAEFFCDIPCKSRQGSALYRLHHHQGHPSLFCQAAALHPRLLLGVHIVNLDLAEIPVPAAENLLKSLITVMEGKSQIPDLSLSLHLLQFFHHAQPSHFPETLPVQGVHQVKIYVIRAQFLKLLLEYSVHILQSVHIPAGQFCGQVIRISGVLLQHLSHKSLALPAVVGIGCVYVVYSCGQCRIHHLLRLDLINFSLRCHGKPHAPESQKGSLNPQFLQRSHLHIFFPPKFSPASALQAPNILLCQTVCQNPGCMR